MKNFGEILKANREHRGILQDELARWMGMDRTYVSKLERPDSNPTYSTIVKLSQSMGISPSIFLAIDN